MRTGRPFSPDPQGEKSGRPRPRNSQEGPKFQLREPPPPLTASGQPGLQQWAPEARPMATQVYQDCEAAGRMKERPQDQKDANDLRR